MENDPVTLGSAGYLTNFAARLFVRRIQEQLNPLGLSVAAMPVIMALARRSPLTQRELAAAAAIEQPTMAATLARLERDGVIVRTADPSDGRSALVSLSRDAQDKLPAVLEAARSVNGHALSALSEHEQALFFDIMQRVIGRLSEGP